jgi:hypothetical protein
MDVSLVAHMPLKKKSVARKSARRNAVKRAQNTPELTRFWGAEESVTSNGKDYEQPHYKNPETAEEREKRLAKREALTLQAFQIAYDNHHQRKSS